MVTEHIAKKVMKIKNAGGLEINFNYIIMWPLKCRNLYLWYRTSISPSKKIIANSCIEYNTFFHR